MVLLGGAKVTLSELKKRSEKRKSNPNSIHMANKEQLKRMEQDAEDMYFSQMETIDSSEDYYDIRQSLEKALKEVELIQEGKLPKCNAREWLKQLK